MSSCLFLYNPCYFHQYHCRHQHINPLFFLISTSGFIITFSCHHAVRDSCTQKNLKVTFIIQIKAATTDSGPAAHVSGPHGVKTPSLRRSGWQQQHMAPQWLRSISSCNGFVGVSGAVDLQRDINSWNENRRLIGYGCIVDSGAVNSWSVARVSDSERVPRAEDHHHTPLIDSNCNPSLTVTVFNCQRRRV